MKMTGSHRAEIIRTIFTDITATVKKNYGKDEEDFKKWNHKQLKLVQT